ncbi:MAG: polysaccharide biosynthesis/export family protein [Desulfobulbus sp.]|jgi:polysaccharide export outer membrane protein|nr:polysaccharide biosynthesis/export family protein [Desulfobulbus sp.]
MDKPSSTLKVIVAALAVLLLTLCGNAFAAQSTADAVADVATKEQLRKEILGDATFPGEDAEYVIGYGDVLAVNIYGEGNMAAAPSAGPTGAVEQQGGGSAGGAVVRMDGRISLLHVGDVNVIGMTLTQMADYLKKLYATVYSDPVVTAVLMQSNSRRYTVMGQVRQPGVFPLDYPITIVQTIARSGGFTEWAKQRITVVRAGDGVKTAAGEGDKNTVKFDYSDLVKGKGLDQNIHIKSGDIVIVD